ncbi:MAG: TIGR03087 family PEP-CTERM/XrtA system glycosyltransferase, partial [Gammaproteobacteria bacterium]
GQYLDEVEPGTKRVIDYVDVDSEKWRVYGAAKPWPLRTLYRREWRRLGQFERSLVRHVDHCIFVSAPEAALFQAQLDTPASNVSFVNNGVDLQYFDPALNYLNPYPSSTPICVFTGAMDYWANVDAVEWFAKAIFPALKARVADLEFWIVGARPTPAVRILEAVAGIHVTGSVPDVRPYLRHATLAVAPMRIARGVQNKVLEAMAMDIPVIGTHAAFEGLAPPPSFAPLRVDDAHEFARHCETMLRAAGAYPVCLGGREYLKEAHDWRTSMAQLRNLMVA